MASDFMLFSALFQSGQDSVRMIMKGVQCNPNNGWTVLGTSRSASQFLSYRRLWAHLNDTLS